MLMPGKPAAPTGAEGQINVQTAFEAAESPGDGPESGDDRPTVPVGSQEHGPDAPAHGAAGGLDVNFTEVAPDLFEPTSTSTSMTTSHPAFGGALAADLGEK